LHTITLLALITTAAPNGLIHLVQEGKATSEITTLEGDPSTRLLDMAVENITGPVETWTGVRIPVNRHEPEAFSLERPSVVLATLDTFRNAAPGFSRENESLLALSFMEEHSFIITPATLEGATHVLVIGKDARGVFNGSQYVRDFLLDGDEQNVHITTETVLRDAALCARACYLLTIWKNEAEYTVEDWHTVFDSFARDGLDRVYFWVSGHFPSAKFPATYRCVDGEWDTTVKSNIGEVEGLRNIVEYGRELGLKVYLGGALGGWCGTYFLTGLGQETLKTGPGIRNKSLCPSHPRVRADLITYYRELFDAIPEADGLYIESADEMGDCQCERCSRVIDDDGSTAFGQYQITLIQELMSTIWEKHPHARLCYTIGYSEHKNDPAYYSMIRNISDPRIEWMEARNSWEFPGSSGATLPAVSVSKQILKWRMYENSPLSTVVDDMNRVQREGFHGSIMTFSPGFFSGTFYQTIPFPVDSIPWALLGFVYRESTWRYQVSEVEIRRLTGQRFFGSWATEEWVDALWTVRELVREAAAGASPDRKKQIAGDLKAIRHRAEAALGEAPPKARETLQGIIRVVDDMLPHVD